MGRRNRFSWTKLCFAGLLRLPLSASEKAPEFMWLGCVGVQTSVLLRCGLFKSEFEYVVLNFDVVVYCSFQKSVANKSLFRLWGANATSKKLGVKSFIAPQPIIVPNDEKTDKIRRQSKLMLVSGRTYLLWIYLNKNRHFQGHVWFLLKASWHPSIPHKEVISLASKDNNWVHDFSSMLIHIQDLPKTLSLGTGSWCLEVVPFWYQGLHSFCFSSFEDQIISEIRAGSMTLRWVEMDRLLKFGHVWSRRKIRCWAMETTTWWGQNDAEPHQKRCYVNYVEFWKISGWFSNKWSESEFACHSKTTHYRVRSNAEDPSTQWILQQSCEEDATMFLTMHLTTSYNERRTSACAVMYVW